MLARAAPPLPAHMHPPEAVAPLTCERFDVGLPERALQAQLFDGFVVGLVVHGAVIVVHRGQRLLAPAGTVITIDRHAVVGIEPMRDLRGTVRLLIVDDATPDGSWGSTGPFPRFAAPLSRDDALAAAIAAISDHADTAYTSGCHETLLARLLAAIEARRGGAPPCHAGSVPPSLEAARAHLLANYSKRLTLDALAGVARLSPFHFAREFKKAFGLPPRTYLERLRVAKARCLIARGHRLSWVSLSVGFCDQSHLNRAFKRVVGVTPGLFASRGRSDAVWHQVNGTRDGFATRGTRAWASQEGGRR